MVIRSQENLLGAQAFFAGIILAIIVGIANLWFIGSSINPILLTILAVLGLIVGYFVSEQDVSTFLLASICVVISSFAGVQGIILNAAVLGASVNKIMTSILGALLFLFVPSTIVVAIKTVFSLAKR
jgi:uncharacterized membrane protein YccC